MKQTKRRNIWYVLLTQILIKTRSQCEELSSTMEMYYSFSKIVSKSIIRRQELIILCSLILYVTYRVLHDFRIRMTEKNTWGTASQAGKGKSKSSSHFQDISYANCFMCLNWTKQSIAIMLSIKSNFKREYDIMSKIFRLATRFPQNKLQKII